MPNAQRRIGYFCNLVPHEILAAAGLQPSRVAGQAETTAIADSYLCSNLCPYIKSVLTTAIEEKDGKLAGVVFARSCDGMRRLYDVWKAYVNNGFIYLLEVPKNNDELALSYYAAQLRELAGALGQAFQREITVSGLQEAIKSANQNRLAMRKLYEAQRSLPAPVRGSELFRLGLKVIQGDSNAAASATAADSGNDKEGKRERKKPRILISGNVMDRPDLFELIEEAGAEAPVADLCTALRYFSREVDENNPDPYYALAQAYLGQPHCSRTAAPAQRVAEISKLVADYRIDGVLLTSVKFCDFQLYDAPYVMKELQQAGTPVLFLENDYTFSSRNQLKVRVEAFVEMLEQ